MKLNWDDLKPNNLATFLCENVERQLDTKAIKKALKGAVNDMGGAEDSLKETEASIRETTSETLPMIRQRDTSIHPPRGGLKPIIPRNLKEQGEPVKSKPRDNNQN